MHSAVRWTTTIYILTFTLGGFILYQTAALESEIKQAGFTIIEATDIAKLPERFIVAKEG